MREMAATGDLARTSPTDRPVGRRRRAPARDDVRPAHDALGSLSARGGAARAALLARPALDRRRARDPQPAHDHQVGGADAARSPRRRTSTTRRAASTRKSVRLNRVVTDVLDFARPIRFELAPADLVQVCRDAAQAAESGRRRTSPCGSMRPMRRRPSSPTPSGCARCWSTSLTNAQQAVRTPVRRRPTAPSRRSACGLTRRGAGWRIDVIDRGTGIAPRRSAAPVRAVLHDAAHRIGPRPGASRAISSRAWAARSSSTSRPRSARPCASNCRIARADFWRTRVTRGSILLVDDEPKIRQALAQALRDEGHDVIGDRQPARSAAARQRAAVRPAGRRQPDAGAERPGADPRGRLDGRRRPSARRS